MQFKLPTPKELGHKTNYLPLSCVNPNKEYSWEDYDNEVKQLYPIKYFINETLPDLFYYLKHPFVVIFDFIKYNFISKHRYHFLDLRQNDKTSCDYYKYGYIDVRQRMLYAVFNLITEFVEKEDLLLHDRIEFLKNYLKNSNNETDICSDKQCLEFYIKIENLYIWWKFIRKSNYSYLDKLLNFYLDSKNDCDKNIWFKAYNDFEKEEQEMFVEACKLREYLWT